jgi:hypothetical protein
MIPGEVPMKWAITTSPARCNCGAKLQEGLPWCPVCHLPSPTYPDAIQQRVDPGRPPRPEFRIPAVTAAQHTSSTGRWASSATTFGPFGRVVATILVTLPLLLFGAAILVVGFVSIAGIAAYLTVYPRALRQIWARAPRRTPR